jgi:hypothetical protein
MSFYVPLKEAASASFLIILLLHWVCKAFPQRKVDFEGELPAVGAYTTNSPIIGKLAVDCNINYC